MKINVKNKNCHHLHSFSMRSMQIKLRLSCGKFSAKNEAELFLAVLNFCETHSLSLLEKNMLFLNDVVFIKKKSTPRFLLDLEDCT